ncbi:hypothetical protein J6590_045977 [Homalodisca vitripennis]|nr:hypothetical protein J6590_045977 [Homalodisca vitripennis]
MQPNLNGDFRITIACKDRIAQRSPIQAANHARRCLTWLPHRLVHAIGMSDLESLNLARVETNIVESEASREPLDLLES